MSSEQLEAEQKAFAEMMANEFGIIDVEDMMRNGSARDQTRVMIAKKAWQAARSQPAADRAMLLNLMEQFDTQVNVCPRCGEEEDCDTMDMANELREYLRAASQPAAPRVVGDEAITRLKHAIEFNEGICSGNEASLKALGWIGLYGREVLAALQSIAPAQQEPAFYLHRNTLGAIRNPCTPSRDIGGDIRVYRVGFEHPDVPLVPVYLSPQPAQPSVPVAVIEFIEKWIDDGRLQTFEDRQRFRAEAAKLIAAHDGKGNGNG